MVRYDPYKIHRDLQWHEPFWCSLSSLIGDLMASKRALCGMQAFVTELLAMLRTCGLTTPEPFDLPETIFHQPANTFPGETLDRAFQAGRSHFKKDPDILFVLLPNNGGPPTPPSPSLHSVLAQTMTLLRSCCELQHLMHAQWQSDELHNLCCNCCLCIKVKCTERRHISFCAAGLLLGKCKGRIFN